MTGFLLVCAAWFSVQLLISVLVLWRKCSDESDEQRAWLVFRTLTAICEACFVVAALGLLR